MKGKVIALLGRGDVGKSETIKKAYELLKSKYKSATTDGYPEPIIPVRGDIRVVLTINGVKIGIENQGDPEDCPRVLRFSARGRCNVIICSTRTRGKSVDVVNSLEKNNYDVIWFKQEIKSNDI